MEPHAQEVKFQLALQTDRLISGHLDLILSTNITAENAVQLAGIYVAYEADAYLLTTDAWKNHLPSAAEEMEAEKLEREQIITPSLTGDHRRLKQYMQQVSGKYETQAKYDLEQGRQSASSENQALSGKFSQMANIIPDHGKPFIPPPPVTSR